LLWKSAEIDVGVPVNYSRLSISKINTWVLDLEIIDRYSPCLAVYKSMSPKSAIEKSEFDFYYKEHAWTWGRLGGLVPPDCDLIACRYRQLVPPKSCSRPRMVTNLSLLIIQIISRFRKSSIDLWPSFENFAETSNDKSRLMWIQAQNYSNIQNMKVNIELIERLTTKCQFWKESDKPNSRMDSQKVWLFRNKWSGFDSFWANDFWRNWTKSNSNLFVRYLWSVDFNRRLNSQINLCSGFVKRNNCSTVMYVSFTM